MPLDRSFGLDGVVRPGSAGQGARFITVQPDGRILMVGVVGDGPPVDFRLLRLELRGAPDPSFGVSGVAIADGGPKPPSILRPVAAVQADGGIVLADECLPQGVDFHEWVVIRLRPDGSVDHSFSVDGRVGVSSPQRPFSLPVRRVLVREDQRILIVGGSPVLFAAQLLPDGTIDRTFGTEGKLHTTLPGTRPFALDAALDQSGNLVVAGTTQRADSGEDLFVVRYGPDGRPDPDFGINGSTIVDFGVGRDFGGHLAIDVAGRIVVAGSTQTAESFGADGAFDADAVRFAPGLLRLLPDGRLDADFGDGGRVQLPLQPVATSAFTYGLGLLPDGRIAVAGLYSDERGERSRPDFGRIHHFVAMVTDDGRPDPTFDGDDGVAFLPDRYQVGAGEFAMQPDGKLLLMIQGELLRLNPSTEFSALALTIGADQAQAGPGPLTILATVRNDGGSAAGGVLTLSASKSVSVVGTTNAAATVAPDRRNVLAKLRPIQPGATATVILRTTVTGFEGSITVRGELQSGPELQTADNTALLTVLTSRNATI